MVKERPEVTSSDTVFCGNIGQTTEQAIRDLFANVGTIVDIIFAKHKDGKNKGFCHLVFDSPESAAAAVQKKNGQEIDGQKIKLDLAMSKKDFQSHRSE